MVPALMMLPLYKLEFNFAGYIFLGGVYECLDGLAQRSEPFALVYNLSQFVAHVLLDFHGGAVKNQLLQLLVGLHQDGSAGSLINAAGLHADHAVLYDVYNTDAVLAAQGHLTYG